MIDNFGVNYRPFFVLAPMGKGSGLILRPDVAAELIQAKAGGLPVSENTTWL